MINSAHRVVLAEEIEPGSIVLVESGRFTVDQVSILADGVQLIGVGATGRKGRVRTTVSRRSMVQVLAPARDLDAIEEMIVENLTGGGDLACKVDDGHLMVELGAQTWAVALRTPADG